jgi:DnaJ-class molecular chaperone
MTNHKKTKNSNVPEEPITKVPCPECKGKCMKVVRNELVIKGEKCGVCDGSGMVSAQRNSEWKLVQKTGLKTD